MNISMSVVRVFNVSAALGPAERITRSSCLSPFYHSTGKLYRRRNEIERGLGEIAIMRDMEEYETPIDDLLHDMGILAIVIALRLHCPSVYNIFLTNGIVFDLI